MTVMTDVLILRHQVRLRRLRIPAILRHIKRPRRWRALRLRQRHAQPRLVRTAVVDLVARRGLIVWDLRVRNRLH